MHPTIATFGPFHIYSYGLMTALGVLFALLLIRKEAPGIGLSPEKATDLVIWFVLTSFLGARVFYGFQHRDEFSGEGLVMIFKLWEGGLVFYGGLIAGIFYLMVYGGRRAISPWKLTDLLSPFAALAHSFGRIGCFLNGCCYGRETGLPWGVEFPLMRGLKVHPTQIYESVFNFFLFLWLYRLFRRREQKRGQAVTPASPLFSSRFDGEVTLLYLTIYAGGRFLIEFLRGDQRRLALGASLAQWVSALIFVGALGLFLLFSKKTRKGERLGSQPVPFSSSHEGKIQSGAGGKGPAA